MRQVTLTKKLFKLSKNLSKGSNFINSIGFTVMNILLRANLFFFLKDLNFFFNSKKVFLNSTPVLNKDILLFVGDCLQIPVSTKYFVYLRYFKGYFRRKLAEYKKDSWKFFKKKFLKRQFHIKRS